jgi:hypothetical protein
LAPIAALEPSSLVHAGINLARNSVANSRSGMEFMQKSFLQGVNTLPKGRALLDKARKEVGNLELRGTHLSQDVEGPTTDLVQSGVMSPMEASPVFSGLDKTEDTIATLKGLFFGAQSKPLGRLKELMYDTLVSPAALDAQRIGTAISKMLETPDGQHRLKRVVAALGPQGRSWLETLRQQKFQP